MQEFNIYISDDDLAVILTEIGDVDEWLQHAVYNKIRWTTDHICYQEGHDPKFLDEDEKDKIVKKSKTFKDGTKLRAKWKSKPKKKIKYKPSTEDAWRLE